MGIGEDGWGKSDMDLGCATIMLAHSCDIM